MIEMGDNDVLIVQLGAMREDVAEIKGAMEKVADALERLARLEERHTTVAGALERAFSMLSKLDERLKRLELAQPVQRLASWWVINGMWAAGGMLTMLLLKKMGVM